MSAYHVGLEVVAHVGGEDGAVEEDGGLGHLGLLQVFGCAGKHEVGDAEADNLVGALKHVAAVGVVVV